MKDMKKLKELETTKKSLQQQIKTLDKQIEEEKRNLDTLTKKQEKELFNPYKIAMGAGNHAEYPTITIEFMKLSNFTTCNKGLYKAKGYYTGLVFGRGGVTIHSHTEEANKFYQYDNTDYTSANTDDDGNDTSSPFCIMLNANEDTYKLIKQMCYKILMNHLDYDKPFNIKAIIDYICDLYDDKHLYTWITDLHEEATTEKQKQMFDAHIENVNKIIALIEACGKPINEKGEV